MVDTGREWSASFAGATTDAMEVYDRVLARLFTPWAHDLVDRLSPEPGAAVLDVACGPGTVAHILAERVGPSGHVIAIDVSPAMLAVARSKPVHHDVIEWIEAPADPLPVPTKSISGVTCQQGLQFFTDKTAALAEMRRTLVDGGRALVSIWTQIEEMDFFRELYESVAAAVSRELADRYKPPFMLSGEEAAKHAEAAGFTDVELERVTLPGQVEGGAAAFIETLAASGIASEIAALGDEQRGAILDELALRTRRFEQDGTWHGKLTASVLNLA
ncbi:MAG: class I SAM-dependent methyltransferase [Actinomycetota bacterium]|nr:class I SAM-dependent methyltransferase [Actinomycetota bacterium]